MGSIIKINESIKSLHLRFFILHTNSVNIPQTKTNYHKQKGTVNFNKAKDFQQSIHLNLHA